MKDENKEYYDSAAEYQEPSNFAPKNFSASIRKLFGVFKSYFVWIIISIVFAGASSLLTVFGASKISDITDFIKEGIMTNIDLDKVAHVGIILIFMYLVSTLLSSAQGIIMANVTQKIAKKLRRQMSEKIKRLPMGFFHNTKTGDILSRVTNDVDSICQSLNMCIEGLVSSMMMFFGALIMMIITSWKMTLAIVGSTVLGFVIMGLLMGKSQKYFYNQQKDLGRVNGFIEEMYSGHIVIKAFSNEENTNKEFYKINDDLRKSNFWADCISGFMMPIMTYIGNLGYVAVCVVGGMLTMKGDISFGVIVAFMLYVNYFIQPLAQIGQGAQSLQMAVAAGERVFEFLEEEEMEPEVNIKTWLQNVKGDIKFNNVVFGYNYPEKVIINNFSAEAKSGQKIAIVGKTGAGKTTLINLLMRFYDINEGSITIDGVPINNISKEALRMQFAMVLQDTWLFQGTIRENLTLSAKNITDERLDEVCRAVGIYHFIKTLPKKYDTEINESVNLSSGQRQQLAIARAMIADRKMLILDEATSSVDTRLEQQIQSSMDILMEGRTTFVIAHRLSTIINADLILVMSEGDIVESGNHNDLMQKNGVYAELYNSQFTSSLV